MLPLVDPPYQPRSIDGNLAGRHIVSVEQFARRDLESVFRSAADLRTRVSAGDRTVFKLCQRRIMATLFFEASTRTDMSFQAAMLRLGGEVVATAGGVQFSSVYKGENLADTVRAAGSYADVIVLRHPEVRSSYVAAAALDQLASRLGTRPIVISGGDGIGEHPTQALLDLFTIIDFKHQADGLTITLVGDLANGRTVHSLAKLLALYGAQGRPPRAGLSRVASGARSGPRVRPLPGCRRPTRPIRSTRSSGAPTSSTGPVSSRNASPTSASTKPLPAASS